MIDAGSGYPPHWRGEAGDANLATAQAMQGPTERHLLRRQQYFTFILQDILYHAYLRSGSGVSTIPRLHQNPSYAAIFNVITSEVSRYDSEALARATRDLAAAVQNIASLLPGRSRTFTEYVLKTISRASGQPLDEGQIARILTESDNGLPEQNKHSPAKE
jgi:hypothetical protein